MRVDLSEHLVHFTRGSLVEAEQAFRGIITERKLRGSDKGIRGGYKVVCFSEPQSMFLPNYLQVQVTRFATDPSALWFPKLGFLRKAVDPSYTSRKRTLNCCPRSFNIVTSGLIVQGATGTLRSSANGAFPLRAALGDSHVHINRATARVGLPAARRA